MVDNINKLLYLAFGVILLVMALSSFYKTNQSYININDLYEHTNSQQDSWMKSATRETRNPLGIMVSDVNLVKNGLVYSGSETKAQLVVMHKELTNYIIYKDGVEVLEDNYISLYNSIQDSEQLLITFDESLKAVYITCL